MKIIPAGFMLSDLNPEEGKRILQRIEMAGRTCYKSEANNPGLDFEKTKAFVKGVLERGHESVLEHEKITVRIICDRGVTHEIVRHRLASYSQESTRYCNYGSNKFGNEVLFIDLRHFLDNPQAEALWLAAMQNAEDCYLGMLKLGVSPQFARSVLPNSLKTEIVVTANVREWRHIFKLRTAKAAHPQMREIMVPLLRVLCGLIPVVFDDIVPYEENT
jgi:thymidylate synthase (FAD)